VPSPVCTLFMPAIAAVALVVAVILMPRRKPPRDPWTFTVDTAAARPVQGRGARPAR
jgi:hypothetical protein